MGHTPGPWKVTGTGGTAVAPEWAPNERVCVTMAVNLRENDDGSFPEFGQWQRADAHLIAAAPELLAALKELVDYDGGSSEPESYGYEVLLRCKAAIARAEGRSE